MKWEDIDAQNADSGTRLIQRTPVPGGWLVRSFVLDPHGQERTDFPVALAFVPDAEHTWAV